MKIELNENAARVAMVAILVGGFFLTIICGIIFG